MTRIVVWYSRHDETQAEAEAEAEGLRFAGLVDRIRSAEGVVVDVAVIHGSCLAVIDADLMWNGHAPTFLRWCWDALGMNGSQVRRLLAVAEVDAQLRVEAPGVARPRRIVDYVALHRLPVGVRCDVWRSGATSLPAPTRPDVALLAAQVRLARACAALAPWIGADLALEPALQLALHAPNREPLAAKASQLLTR